MLDYTQIETLLRQVITLQGFTLGALPWARAMRCQLSLLAQESTTELRRFRDYLKHFEQHHGYQQLDSQIPPAKPEA